ncbi:MAG: response regulator transcription factor [Johnsonella sp.]|nr:response regulator transcription factor [Johnsonella sp.]
MRLLIAEDERDLNKIIKKKFIAEGYAVDACFDGREAMEYLNAGSYDAVILDIMMPKADGYEVLSHLRKAGNLTPVLFLTARDAIEDRVEGLDKGANDYLVKPFSLEELSARVRAMTRKSFQMADNMLQIADLSLDTLSRSVKRGEKEISLSAKEFALLEYLMRNAGIILSREKIENHIWSFDYEGGTNLVDVYISYLRRKIDSGQEKRLIHTIRGVGYVIKEEAAGQ